MDLWFPVKGIQTGWALANTIVNILERAISNEYCVWGFNKGSIAFLFLKSLHHKCKILSEVQHTDIEICSYLCDNLLTS